MAYKYTDNNDNRVYIAEDYEGEIISAFERADIDYEKEVDVLYLVDSVTGEDIELWRRDWI